MSNPPTIALCQAQDLPASPSGGAPDWIPLLPAGPEIQTVDARGPYRIVDAAALIRSSAGHPLPIDENHAIDIKGPRGEPSPAVGRIVEMEAREDGSIWGRAEWNTAGQHLMAERAYVGVSPVIIHDGAKRIIGIARASLTNKPNLRGLTALHMENDMSMSAVAKALGLAEDATEDQILAAIAGIRKPDGTATALQSQIGQIGVALGLADSAAPDAIIAAAKLAGAADDKKVITALQTELAEVGRKLTEVQEAGARTRAESYIDGEIKRGRVGVKPLRDHYIAMHMQDAARVEKEIGALPVLNGTSVVPTIPAKDGEVALQSAHLDAARALGLDPKTYAAALKAEHEEAL